jgi:hypothetical protein
MAKIADQIREALKPHLEPDEELRSVGQVTSSSLFTLYLFRIFATYWSVGITQKRVIFVRRKASGKFDENFLFATPLDNVKLNGNKMALIKPEETMPQNFVLSYWTSGNRRVTGLDSDEFKKALTTQERSAA